MITLPQFWLLPVANAFDDVPPWRGPVRLIGAVYVVAAGAATTFVCVDVLSVRPDGADVVGAGAPKMLKDCFPPGGAWIRVVERSVITFPQFWLEPDEKALDDVPVFGAYDAAETVDAIGTAAARAGAGAEALGGRGRKGA